MKKSMRILAMLLAVLMLCGCQSADPTKPATTTLPKGPAEYSVTVTDALGKPMSNVGVAFMQGEEQAGMAITNENGVATKSLERGEYTLKLTFVDIEHSYHTNADAVKLTATQTQAAVQAGYEMGTLSQHLTINGGERAAYTLVISGTSLTVTGVYDKSLDGTYTCNVVENGLQVNDPVIDIQMDLFKKYVFQTSKTNGPQTIVDAENNEVTELVDGTYTVMSNEYDAYFVESGSTYVKLTEAGNNYFVFTPKQAGVYQFSVVGQGTIGSYGTPTFAYSTNDAEITDNTFTKTISQDMIGTNGTGTVELVIGVETETADSNTFLCIQRVGDPPVVVEWEDYKSTYTPEKYTLPAGSTLVNFDLTQSYTLVYNENDQFYHLNSADGPLVLVRLLSANDYSGFAFGNILFGSNIGTYHYDENGTLIQKILYNNCIQQYLGNITGQGESMKFTGGKCDDTEGVYPLTKDLEAILRNYGAYMGYWDNTNPGYLFADVINLNLESAWLFACCYLQ